MKILLFLVSALVLLSQPVLAESGAKICNGFFPNKIAKTSTIYLTQIKDIPGKGRQAQIGDHATIFFELYLDGKLISSNCQRGGPMGLTLGGGFDLRGVELSVMGMKVGGIRRVVIPPFYHYGFKGDPEAGVPPNAYIVADIEVVDLQPWSGKI